jgi:hypothetical protein
MKTHAQIILAVEVAPLRDSVCGIENLLKNRLVFLEFGKSPHLLQAPHDSFLGAGITESPQTSTPAAATGSLANSPRYRATLHEVYKQHESDRANVIIRAKRVGCTAKMKAKNIKGAHLT